MRPSWDDYFLSIVREVASRSVCERRKAGAILVRDRRILTTGYNGPPAGIKHCGDTGGCIRAKMNVPSGQRHELCKAIHAEANAILQAAIHGVSIVDSTLYCTDRPCSGCAKLLIGAQVRRIVVLDDTYPDELTAQLLGEIGIAVEVRS